jgi:hypothetical protein
MTEWASPFLESGEAIRGAVWGPSSAVGYLFGVARGRIAAVTQRHLYLFESSIWGRMSRPRGVVAKYPVGSVEMRLTGWALHIEDERMVVHLHHRGRAQRIVRGLVSDTSRADPSVSANHFVG